MKANSYTATTLRTAIVQLRRVAKTKRVESLQERQDRTTLMQEARQVDDAIRLLRWIKG